MTHTVFQLLLLLLLFFKTTKKGFPSGLDLSSLQTLLWFTHTRNKGVCHVLFFFYHLKVNFVLK